VDQNRPKKGKLTNAIITIFALGCADVFFVVGMLGGFKISTLVGVGILALFVFGCVCSAVYILVNRRQPIPSQTGCHCVVESGGQGSGPASRSSPACCLY
jgi:hypothetical protein